MKGINKSQVNSITYKQHLAANASLKKAKLRLEFRDADGLRYTLSLDGPISKDKIAKLTEMAELLDSSSKQGSPTASPDTLMDRINNLIEQRFPFAEFTSLEILEAYEDTYADSIPLSVVSTYLSRMTDRQNLVRYKFHSKWKYSRPRPLLSQT
jgi:hypothetical protein